MCNLGELEDLCNLGELEDLCKLALEDLCKHGELEEFSNYQSVFTKLGMCIDIVDTWFGIANGQILSIFDRLPACH